MIRLAAGCRWRPEKASRLRGAVVHVFHVGRFDGGQHGHGAIAAAFGLGHGDHMGGGVVGVHLAAHQCPDPHPGEKERLHHQPVAQDRALTLAQQNVEIERIKAGASTAIANARTGADVQIAGIVAGADKHVSDNTVEIAQIEGDTAITLQEKRNDSIKTWGLVVLAVIAVSGLVLAGVRRSSGPGVVVVPMPGPQYTGAGNQLPGGMVRPDRQLPGNVELIDGEWFEVDHEKQVRYPINV